jgi:hypothetical protein
MIWNLAREQMRSQKRYVAWTTALLALIVAMASFSAITATTNRAHEAELQRILGFGLEHTVVVVEATNGPHVDAQGGAYLPYALAPQVVDDIIAQVTRTSTRYMLSALAAVPYPIGDSHAFVVGLEGDVDWDALVQEGRPPRAGEITLSVDTALAMGVDLGDIVIFRGDVRTTPHAGADALYEQREEKLTLVGYSLTDARAEMGNIGIPDGLVTWEDAVKLNETFAFVGSNAQGESTASYAHVLTWDGPLPDIVGDNVPDENYSSGPQYQNRNMWFTSTATTLSSILAALTAFGTVAAGLAIARNQSQTRTKWVATALTLGVPRARIVAATALESVATAVVAGTLGFGLAWLIVLRTLRAEADKYPYAFHLAMPSAPLWLIASLIAVSLLLAVIVIGLPGWWASRTSPVAALKPVSPLSESEPARRIPVRWLWWAFGTSALILPVVSRMSLPVVWKNWTGDAIVSTTALVVFAVTGAMLVIELVRWAIPACAARFGRLSGPWAVAASTQLYAARRQAVFPALAMAATAGALTAVLYEATLTFPNGPSYWHLELYGRSWVDYLDYVLYDPGMVFAEMGALLLAGFLILIVGLTTASANRPQSATQSALGFTRRARVNASLAQHGIPMLMGTTLGTALGVVLPFMNWVTTDVTGNDPPIDRSIGANLEAMPFILIGAAWIAFIAVLVTALTACLIAFMTPQQTPVQALRDSEKAGIA